MNHLKEEELIAYRDGEKEGRAEVMAHLKECPECREELARIEAVFAALDAMPVPDPGADYERGVWQRLEPRLPEKRTRWWEGLFEARRLVAVGTTSVRTLENAAAGGRRIDAASGETDLFIYPGFQFRATGAMLTNFHLPRTSLLLLVCAFGGKEFVLAAYRHAVETGYRFYSYGDCMLLL